MNTTGPSSLQPPDVLSAPWQAPADDLSRAMASVDPVAFDATSTLLKTFGGRWFIEGYGRSGLVARMFAMRLVHLDRTAHVVGDATTPAIQADDGYWAFSGSGRTPALLSHASRAREIGATIIAMTTDTGSPLAQLADVVLPIPKVSTVQIAGSPVELAALALTDALVLNLTQGAPGAYQRMAAVHANLE